MLSLEKITLHIGQHAILDNITLKIPSHSITGLLGPSGSGKTTLIRTVMGLTAPDSGELLYNNQLLTKGTKVRVPATKRNFGYLFQDFTLFPHLNVKKNILIAVTSLDRKTQDKRLANLIELLDIEDLLKRPIHNLSGGEQQRVALARSLISEPEILLLDEPFNNLDKMAQVKLRHDIKSIIKAKQITAIIATHDHEEAFFFSDQLAIMRQAQIIAVDSPSAIYEKPKTEWLANFTGQAHCLTGQEIGETFEHQWYLNPQQTYLIRPENIVIKEGNAGRITANEFYGFYSKISIETQNSRQLEVLQTGVSRLQPGNSVGLTLVNQPMELAK